MAEVAETLATAGHEDAGLTWLMSGSATAMLPATILPTPVPSRIQWVPELRLPQLRLSQLRLSRWRWPQWQLPRVSHLARNLRLSVVDRRVGAWPAWPPGSSRWSIDRRAHVFARRTSSRHVHPQRRWPRRPGAPSPRRRRPGSPTPVPRRPALRFRFRAGRAAAHRRGGGARGSRFAPGRSCSSASAGEAAHRGGPRATAPRIPSCSCAGRDGWNRRSLSSERGLAAPSRRPPSSSS